MKELAAKIGKFIGASIGVLVAAYTVGWSGAITLHNLFKTEASEAKAFVLDQVGNSEEKILAIHRADIDSIRAPLKILIEQNKVIISQNYRTRKIIEEEIK